MAGDTSNQKYSEGLIIGLTVTLSIAYSVLRYHIAGNSCVDLQRVLATTTLLPA